MLSGLTRRDLLASQVLQALITRKYDGNIFAVKLGIDNAVGQIDIKIAIINAYHIASMMIEESDSLS